MNRKNKARWHKSVKGEQPRLCCLRMLSFPTTHHTAANIYIKSELKKRVRSSARWSARLITGWSRVRIPSDPLSLSSSSFLLGVPLHITHKSIKFQKSKHFVIRTPKIQTKISKIFHKSIIYLQFASIKEKI